MGTVRLTHAVASGLRLPDAGRVAAFGATPEDLPPLPVDRLHAIQPFRPALDALAPMGIAAGPSPEPPYAAAVVTLPRARDRAEQLVQQACAATPGGVIVLDGAKTDGVEAMIKALRGRVALDGVVAKAHGKVAWFTATDALDDWARPERYRNAAGDVVAPGLFSADGPDPGSAALAAQLPALRGHVADLGAGWGWLSREILRHDGVTALDVVEAEARALACAQANLDDTRAKFHWADATRWRPEAALDAVVTNPPFHGGRRADPKLGLAFIDAAAAMLKPTGALWLVANRHLPYEDRLRTVFRDLTERGGDTRFKILHASRPVRDGRKGTA